MERPAADEETGVKQVLEFITRKSTTRQHQKLVTPACERTAIGSIDQKRK